MATGRKSYTPPKGRATTPRGAGARRGARIPPTLQWILVGLIIVALVVVALIFSNSGDGGPHGGLGATAVAAVADHVVATTLG